MPGKCPNCASVIQADTIEKELPRSGNPCKIPCPECHQVFQHIPTYARGDPRNIALIGHWDGWQPFGSTGQHSCGKCACIQYMYMMNSLWRSLLGEKGQTRSFCTCSQAQTWPYFFTLNENPPIPHLCTTYLLKTLLEVTSQVSCRLHVDGYIHLRVNKLLLLSPFQGLLRSLLPQ